MKTLPDKLIYPIPFAGGATALLTPFAEKADTDKINFETGFPDKYSTPKSNGGKFVTRGEMNYLGNIATKNDYYKMCGGINTFDPVFAEKIGGYPKDAILDYFDGINLFKVISLVEDNKYDFRNGILNTWAKLGTNDIIPDGKYLLDSFTDYHINGNSSGFIDIGSYSIAKSGIVQFVIKSYSDSKNDDLHYATNMLFGSSFLCRSFKSTDNIVSPGFASASAVASYNGYSAIGGLPSYYEVRSGLASNYVSPNTNIVNVSRGDILRVFVQNGAYSYETQPYNAYGYNIVVSFDIYIV